METPPPRDLANLLATDRTLPEGVRLAMPDEAHVAKRILTSLQPADRTGKEPLVVKSATVTRLGAQTVVEGKAITAVSGGEDVVTATFEGSSGRLRLVEVRVTPGREAYFVPAGVKHLKIKVGWVAYKFEYDPKGTATLHGRLHGRVAIPTATAPEVPVDLRMFPNGTWVVDLVRVGDGLFNSLDALGGNKEALQAVQDVYKVVLDKANLTPEVIEVGIDPLLRTCAFFRFKLSTTHSWKVYGNKVTIDQVDLDLSVQYPSIPSSRRLVGTLRGKFNLWGSTLDCTLSNLVSERNPLGHWLLMPTKDEVPLDGLKTLFNWVGRGDLDLELPDWAQSSSAANGLSMRNLALGVDPTGGGVSLLRGTIQWKQSPSLTGQQKVVALKRIFLGLEIERPFLESRRVKFTFGGEAILCGREFSLSGGKTWGGGWELRAGFAGVIPLTEAIESLVEGVKGGADTPLFGNVALALENPSASLTSEGAFALRADVLVTPRASGGPRSFGVGVGALTVQRGRIALQRGDGETTFVLQTGVELVLDSGPKLEDCSLWLEYKSKRAGSTSATLTCAIEFPTEDPRWPVQIGLRGEYLGGDKGGFRFAGAVNRVPLNPVIEGMLEVFDKNLKLSKDFPELTASELTLTLDTTTGEYSAGGKASASPFMIHDVTVCDAAFEFKVTSSSRKMDTGKGEKSPGAGVSLFGTARVLRRDRAKFKALTAANYKRDDYQNDDFITVVLRIEFDGEKSDYTATINGLMLSDFVAAFNTGIAAPSKEGDYRIAALGFRYRSQKPSKPKDKDAPTAASAMSFFTSWQKDKEDLGRFDLALAKKDDRDSPHPLVVVRPKFTWLSDAEIAWADAPFKDVPLGLTTIPALKEPLPKSAYTFRAGLFLKGTFNLKGTFVETRLGLKDSLTLELRDKIRVLQGATELLALDVTGKARPSGDAKKLEAKSPAANHTAEKKPVEKKLAEKAPADKEGEKTVRFDATLSPALILDKLTPSKDGASSASTWREYLGNCVVLSHIGVTLHTKPTPAVTVFADVGVNVGTWVSVAAKAFSVKLTPASLNVEGVKNLKTDFGLEGAAVSINVPPWFKGGAAIVKEDTTSPPGFRVMGMGEIMLMQKFRIGALVSLQWKRTTAATSQKETHDLHAAFGFVYATGLTIPLAPLPVVVTGIAGGFGYRVVPKLPTRAEDVPKNELVKSLADKAKPEDGTATGMFERLKRFNDSVQIRDDAWCVVFGLSLTLAQVVKCALLVVVESRKTGLELSIMGVANFTLGAKSAASTVLGEVELSVLARFSPSAGTLTVLGAVTGESWIFDKRCKLQGGFAICSWFKGDHAGDFLVSVGGYSPLVPTKAHYPALDRVGLKWEVTKELSLEGFAYLALDRYGLQLGCAAGLKYTTSKVKVDAHFSFDALVEWAPLYYEARLRMSVHLEVKAVVTLRLGLDVDMHLWGPPFGAKVDVKIELGLFNPSFTIDVGEPREIAWNRRNEISLADVVDLAAGGEKHSTFTLTAGGSPAKLLDKKVDAASRWHRFVAERPCATGDVKLTLETAIPAARLYRDQGKSVLVRDATHERGLELRARAWKKITSDLVVLLFRVENGKKSATPIQEGWEVTPEEKQPLESLWCLPEDAKKPWLVKPRTLITAVHVTPAQKNSGGIPDVRLDPFEARKENSVPETAAVHSKAPQPAADREDAKKALQKDRRGIYEALKGAGFKLGECPKKQGFRPRKTTRPLMTKLCPEPVE